MKRKELEAFKLHESSIIDLSDDVLHGVIVDSDDELFASAAAQELLRRKEMELHEMKQSRAIKSLGEWREEIDSLFDSLADADVISWTVHRPVKEIESCNGWKCFDPTGDVLISIHLREEVSDA